MVVVVGVISLAVPAAHAAGTPPGALETSYGDKGVAAVDLPGLDYAEASVVQADGKTVLAGSSDNALTVTRFTTSGRLDPSFGGTGAVRVRQQAGAAAVRIAPDGSIFVAGTTWRSPHRSSNPEVNNALGFLADGSRLLIAKLTPSGRLDRSFGRDGIVVTQPEGLHPLDEATVDMVLTPSGSVSLLAVRGVSEGFYGYSAAVVLQQFTAAGAVDPTFGVNGVAPAGPPSLIPLPVALAVQPDGRLIVGATYVEPWFVPFTPPSSELLVSRYLASGQPDGSFGVGGFARHDVDGGSDFLEEMALDASGRILLFGSTTDTIVRLLTSTYSEEDLPSRLFVMRLDAKGATDTSFAGTGVAIVKDPPRTLYFLESGIVQGDGRVVVAVYDSQGAVRLQRLGADGRPDPSFERSRVPLAWVSSLSTARGRIVAAGAVNNQTGITAAAAFAS